MACVCVYELTYVELIHNRYTARLWLEEMLLSQCSVGTYHKSHKTPEQYRSKRITLQLFIR